VTARFGPRFGAESALIIAAAVFAYLLQFSWPGVAAMVFGAWFVVAVFEVVAARAAPQPVPGADDEAGPAPEVEAAPEIAPEPAQPPRPPLLARPATGVPVQPPPPLPGPEAIEAAEEPGVPAPPEAAPPPAVAPPAPTPAPVVVPPPPPVAAPPPPVAPSTPPAAPPAGDGGWNLWALERAAREQAGRNPVRDEERSFLLMYLREFADAEGNLPDEFDGLVRDSFGDLVGSGR
jgi:hypothetical protein